MELMKLDIQRFADAAKVISLSNLSTFKDETIKYIQGPAIDMILAMNLGVYSSDEISEAIGGANGFMTFFNDVKRTKHVHLVNSFQPGSGEWDCYNVSTYELSNEEVDMKNISFSFIAEGTVDGITKVQITYDRKTNTFYGYQKMYGAPGVVAEYGMSDAFYCDLNSNQYFENASEWGVFIDTAQANGIPPLPNGTYSAMLKSIVPIMASEEGDYVRQDLYVIGAEENEHWYRTVSNISTAPVYGDWQNISETAILMKLGLKKSKRPIEVGDNLRGKQVFFDIPASILSEADNLNYSVIIQGQDSSHVISASTFDFGDFTAYGINLEDGGDFGALPWYINTSTMEIANGGSPTTIADNDFIVESINDSHAIYQYITVLD